MSGSVDELAAEEFLIVRFVYNFLVSGFILDDHQPVARCMESEDWNVDSAIEDDVPLQILDRIRVCLDSRSMIQSFQVFVQIQASLFIERMHLVTIPRTLEL